MNNPQVTLTADNSLNDYPPQIENHLRLQKKKIFNDLRSNGKIYNFSLNLIIYF